MFICITLFIKLSCSRVFYYWCLPFLNCLISYLTMGHANFFLTKLKLHHNRFYFSEHSNLECWGKLSKERFLYILLPRLSILETSFVSLVFSLCFLSSLFCALPFKTTVIYLSLASIGVFELIWLNSYAFVGYCSWVVWDSLFWSWCNFKSAIFCRTV